MKIDGRVKVLSTTAMIDDLVGEIGRDRIDHITLIRGEIDPHSYELVKGDEEKIAHAKIVFNNGLGLEHGASLQYQLQKHPGKVALGNEIQKRANGAMIYVDGKIDPHVWMDISLWAVAIDPIVEALSNVDPEHAAFYVQNGAKLRENMLASHQIFVEKLHGIPEKLRYLVTSHDAFNYFARAYLAEESEQSHDAWRKRFVAPEGLAPDGQLSSKDIQKTIDHLHRYQIHSVFPESNVSHDSLKKIVSACKEKGLEVKISSAALYGDAMGPPNSAAHTYLSMIGHNCTILLREWGVQ
ncbi:MAG: metal ABC transporter solute-binding protein, Zn/Mn family [Chlamydiales bacterium]